MPSATALEDVAAEAASGIPSKTRRRIVMERLALVLKIRAVVFVAYGLSFLLAPDFTLDTIFGWEGAETFFARIAGATFLALGWFDWLVASRLESRFDMVWPLVLVPALLLAVVVGQRVAGNYDGTEFFYWTSIAVTVFFTAAVGGSRLAVGTTETPAAGRTQLETG
ncbi:MAG: hypothetical protein ACE5GC_06895 [Acidimicrobiia bacterium]